MTPNSAADTPAPRPSPSTARAAGVVLEDEFKTPFAFFAAATGLPVSTGLSIPPAHAEPSAAAVVAFAGRGLSRVVPLGGGRYELTLLIYEAQRPTLVAVGVVAGIAGADADRTREREWLGRWLESVAARLKAGDQAAALRRAADENAAQASRAWGVVLGVDDAIRRTRAHADGDRARDGLLRSARGFVGAQSVYWLPRRGAGREAAPGGCSLTPPEQEFLADLLTREGGPGPAAPVLMNEYRAGAWAGRLPRVWNLLGVPVADARHEGWVVAVNKCDPGGGGGGGDPRPARFRRADATALLPFAALVELQVRGAGKFEGVKELLVGLTRALTAAVDAKDSYTHGHSERVARVAVELGRGLDLTEDELSDLYLAGLLHDIGKIGVRDAVLSKDGPLTAAEAEHVRRHAAAGHQILAGLRPLSGVLPGVRNHHERYDGGGYPDGLAGDDIPLVARILAVADAYDAMTARRPYRAALTPAAVEAEFRRGSGTQWDPRVVEALFRRRGQVDEVRRRGVGKSLNQALDGVLRGDGSVRAALPGPRPDSPAPRRASLSDSHAGSVSG